MCKMIYKFIQPFVLLWFWVLLLTSYQNVKYTSYLSYIVNLNFWETNTLFIFLFFLLFIKVGLRLIVFCFFSLLFTNIFFWNYYFKKKILSSLIVGTIVLHPLGFYLFTMVFFLKFYFINTHTFVLKTSFNLSRLAFFLSLTLFLGSLWASQSNSWGYFWVNDAVEWLLLLIIIYTLIFIHLWVKLNSYNFNLLILILFNFLLLIRLNFLPTRHNFIATTSTIYFLFFFYMFFFNWGSSVFFFIKKSYSPTSWFIVLTLIFIFQPLLCLKFYFLVLVLVFLNHKLNQFVISPVFHLLVVVFLTLWLIFFKFFFLNYSTETSLFISDLYVFFSLFTSSFSVFKPSHSYFLLEFVDFFVDWNSHFSNLTVSCFKLLVGLNNWILFYFCLFLFTFIKRVEFGFLYKKKTLI